MESHRVFVYLEMSLFPSIFSAFYFVWRVRLSYLVTTGWIFYISLCENSIQFELQWEVSNYKEPIGTDIIIL